MRAQDRRKEIAEAASCSLQDGRPARVPFSFGVEFGANSDGRAFAAAIISLKMAYRLQAFSEGIR